MSELISGAVNRAAHTIVVLDDMGRIHATQRGERKPGRPRDRVSTTLESVLGENGASLVFAAIAAWKQDQDGIVELGIGSVHLPNKALIIHIRPIWLPMKRQALCYLLLILDDEDQTLTFRAAFEALGCRMQFRGPRQDELTYGLLDVRGRVMFRVPAFLELEAVPADAADADVLNSTYLVREQGRRTTVRMFFDRLLTDGVFQIEQVILLQSTTAPQHAV